jgi:hypothetical protein
VFSGGSPSETLVAMSWWTPTASPSPRRRTSGPRSSSRYLALPSAFYRAPAGRYPPPDCSLVPLLRAFGRTPQRPVERAQEPPHIARAILHARHSLDHQCDARQEPRRRHKALLGHGCPDAVPAPPPPLVVVPRPFATLTAIQPRWLLYSRSPPISSRSSRRGRRRQSLRNTSYVL